MAKLPRATTVLAIRVGPVVDGATKYVVGFAYPPQSIERPIGTRGPYRAVEAFPCDDAEHALDAVLIAPQALAFINFGPNVAHWPDDAAGLSAAKRTAQLIPDAVVIRTSQAANGPPMGHHPTA